MKTDAASFKFILLKVMVKVRGGFYEAGERPFQVR